jgi:hypothetical protein
MASLRTHDVVLAEGTFRVVLTEKRRVLAVLDAPTTALGPLHIVLAVDREPYLAEGISPLVLTQRPMVETAGLFDDIGHAVSHAAEGAFNAASHAATAIARPAFNLVKAASSEGVHLLAHTIPFLPDKDRRKLDAAARTVMRAKLGDLDAKQFIKGIADAAKAGEHAAMHIGDTLMDASKVVSHIAELPLVPLEHVPGLGPFVKSVSPFQTWNHMADAIKHGDLKQMEQIAKQQLSIAQGVVSLIPGVGTGISAAISAGLAVLEGGGALEVAIRTAYGAIPIPPGIRQVTDTVVDTVLKIAFHHESLTDVVVNVARDQIPEGLPRHVFDTLINLVVHHQPVARVAGGLLDHFVKQYAPAGVGLDLPKALAGAASHLPNVFAALPPGLMHIPPLPHLPGLPPHLPQAPHATHVVLPFAHPASPRMVQPLHAAHA